jgi:VWFA-related protein
VAVALVCAAVSLGGQQQDAELPQQPVFRGGVNLVRVDVIVTGRNGEPVTDLTQDDFEVFEDGRPQTIEQFRLVDATGAGREDLPPVELRTRDDELFDAEREDVRVFAILLDDYHVARTRSNTVRDTLVRFIREHVRPNDLLTLVYPLTPVTTLTFTRDHESISRAIRTFEGRKGDYTPRNAAEEQHWRNLPAIERIRTDVVIDALSALSVRLGSLREGRKSIILVSDGFGANQLRLRDVQRDANRNNVSIYPFDPCGLTMTQGFTASGQPDCSSSRVRRDTLRVLAEETDGRAIVNRNSLTEGLAQIARDASYYYLLGYTSTQPANDGQFHELRVQVKRRGVDVRARKGFWTLSAAEVTRAATARPVVLTPVQRALAAIDIAADARRYVRTWVGSERGNDGLTQVTVAWELLPRRNLQQWEQPGRVSVTAAAADGTLHFQGDGTITAAPQRMVFSAPPGRLDVRVAVASAGNGETIDREVLNVDVPDLTAPLALSTPRVYVARTGNEFRTLAADAAAVPTARREFARTERLLIRFDAYGAGPQTPTAAVVNWAGERLTGITVQRAETGGSHQISIPLGSLAPGEYAIEIVATGEGAETRQLVPLRVGS